MGFKQKIYLTVGFLLVLGYGIFSTTAYMGAKKDIQRGVELTLSQVSQGAAEYLNSWIGYNLSTLVGLSATLGTHTSSQQELIMPFLENSMRGLNVPDVYIGFEDGVFVDGSGWVAPAEYDPRKRGWYMKAKELKKASVSEVYEDAITKKLITTAMAPVVHNGVFKGVVGADVTLDALTHRANSTKIEGGYLAFMDDKGIFLAHPSKSSTSSRSGV